MSSNSTTDFFSIKQYLMHFNIDIDFDDFYFQVKSHPDYPSLLAFSDALHFFNVKNAAYKLDYSDDFNRMPDNFVALLRDADHFTEELAWLQVKENRIFKNGKPVGWENIEKNWGGVIFLVKKSIESSRATKERKINWRFSVIVFSLLCAIVPIGWGELSASHYFLLIFSLLGLFVTFEIYKTSMGEESVLSEGLCKHSNKIDCHSVINSTKWALLKKIDLSDLSLAFFLTQIAAISFMEISRYRGSLFAILDVGLWLVIPLSVISVYYQFKVEKKWCLLCISIITILYFELIFIQALQISYSLSVIGILMFTGLFFAIYLFWTSLKRILIRKADLEEKEIEQQRFRRNFRLFELTIKNQKKVRIQDGHMPIVLGNPEGSLKLTVVTNPFCAFCGDAHKIIEDLQLKYSGDILINLFFTINPEGEKDLFKLGLHRYFIQLYLEEGSNAFLKAFAKWFNDGDPEVWRNRIEDGVPVEKLDSVLKSQFNFCETNNLFFTPTFLINDHIYPEIYRRDDIQFFVNDLIDISPF